jgi:hypothetical protein
LNLSRSFIMSFHQNDPRLFCPAASHYGSSYPKQDLPMECQLWRRICARTWVALPHYEL